MYESFQTPASVTVRRRLAQVRPAQPASRVWDRQADAFDDAPWTGASSLSGRGLVAFFRNLLGATPRRSPSRDMQPPARARIVDALPLPALDSRPPAPFVRAYEAPDLPWQWG